MELTPNHNEIIIFWFRTDLRLTDNPGFYEATKLGSVIPVFIVDKASQPMGSASKWWLYHSLNKLNCSLEEKLNIYEGDYKEVLCSLIEKTTIAKIYCSQCHEPSWIEKDREIKKINKPDKLNCLFELF